MASQIPIAYCGPPPVPSDLFRSWNLDPWLLGLLALVAVAGFMASGLTRGRRIALLAAVGVLAVAFVSPLCPLTTALFSARGAHHLLLYAAAAPLLALAMPLKTRVSGSLAFAISTVALWVWHLPPVYSAALADTGVYWLLQSFLLASGWLFWAQVLGARSSPLSGLPMVALGAGQMGLLAAVLTFAPAPLYAEHLLTTGAFGLSPLEDQQLSGLIMWAPGTAVFLFVALWLGQRSWARLAWPT